MLNSLEHCVGGSSGTEALDDLTSCPGVYRLLAKRILDAYTWHDAYGDAMKAPGKLFILVQEYNLRCWIDKLLVEAVPESAKHGGYADKWLLSRPGLAGQELRAYIKTVS